MKTRVDAMVPRLVAAALVEDERAPAGAPNPNAGALRDGAVSPDITDAELEGVGRMVRSTMEASSNIPSATGTGAGGVSSSPINPARSAPRVSRGFAR